MARMIPAQIDERTVSNAERRIFSLLERDAGTKEWTVLHSLNLARRPSGPYGEIDFVAIIPTEGIVCLEVKGGQVSCQDGVWQTRDRYDRGYILSRSPFDQSRDNMFALRDAIIKKFGANSAQSDFPFGCCTVFPDVSCPPITPEFERTDAIDVEDLRGPISKPILRLAKNRLRPFRKRHSRFPNLSEIKDLKNCFRPEFDQILARSVTIARSEENLLRLTDEQYMRLDELEANPRCLFEGAAGTGKTLLAVEFARRAERAGEKVIFICYNRLLGERLRKQSEGWGITTGTWHRVARNLILSSNVGEEFKGEETNAFNGGDTRKLFGELYPFYFEVAIEEMGPRFDVLVMDEAQDLCTPEILHPLSLAMRGGLAESRWAVFGDFTRQALYGETRDPIKILSSYSKHFVRAKLTRNCRNTRKIAEETTVLSGFDEPPFGYGWEKGLPVEHKYWKNSADLERSLNDTLVRLAEDGIPFDDVVILSPRRLESSCLSECGKLGDLSVLDCSLEIDTASTPSIRFSTIYAFKGLESKVVIVVDVEEAQGNKWQSLMYVAMSRASSLLFLYVNAGFRAEFESRLNAVQNGA